MGLYLGAQAQGGTPYPAAAPTSSSSSSQQDHDLTDLLIDRAVTGSGSSLHGKLDTATSEAMKDLKMEVMERLGRLQQVLCI